MLDSTVCGSVITRDLRKIWDLVRQSELSGPIGVYTANEIPGVTRIDGGRRGAILSPQIYPLAPGAIFWNNRFRGLDWAVNRLDRKPT